MTDNLETQLSSFSAAERGLALRQIAERTNAMKFPSSENVNMHFHSFYSFNAEGWSPSRIAWEVKKSGLHASGIVDFDVIDGMDEYLAAAELLGIRASVGVESRTFFAKFADAEMDSPGEPGVNYVMGVGFTGHFSASSPQALKLAQYRENARQRNLALISRINAKVPEIALDYEKDVIPLTPSGNATERHIITAYAEKSMKAFSGKSKAFSYLSSVLGKGAAEIEELFTKSRPAFDELLRAKFAKKGGIGYVQPSQDTFPPMREFLAWVKSAGAIPTEAWLDGTTKGESLGIKYLEASRAEGSEALNIIPDRNWNIKDPEVKKIKVAKLAEVVAAADKLDMPIFIGTEMNKAGQPFADQINCEALAPHKKSFIKGAAIAVGQSLLAKFAKFSYSGEKAAAHFKSVSEKNIFFESVGELPPLDSGLSARLSALSPDAAFAKFADSAKAGRWML